MTVFDFESYKAYLRQKIASFPKKGWGERSRLARALGCQTAFIAQVLNKNLHLSGEQAHAVNLHWGHSKVESQFFLLLLQYERAGSGELRDFLRQQMDDFKGQHHNIATKVEVAPFLAEEDKVVFYSSWFYAAIHVLISIPRLQTKEALAQHLNLPLQRVSEILEFLVHTGLAQRAHNRVHIGQTRIHLPDGSPHIQQYHTNFRSQVIASLERKSKDDLHYSSVVSLSQQDFARLRSQLIDVIDEAKALIKDSKEEQAAVFCLDFFHT